MSDLKFSNHAAGRDDHSGRAQHALPALDFLGREGGAGGVRSVGWWQTCVVDVASQPQGIRGGRQAPMEPALAHSAAVLLRQIEGEVFKLRRGYFRGILHNDSVEPASRGPP